MPFRVTNRKTRGLEKVKFFNDGLSYIRYCLLKETGTDLSIQMLRQIFDYAFEYIINTIIQKKGLWIYKFGLFYTKEYPESIKGTQGGKKVFVPAFDSPAINFSTHIRKAIKAKHYPCSAPEFLDAKQADYQALFHKVRVVDYKELNIEEPFDGEEVALPIEKKGMEAVDLEKTFQIEL